MMGNSCYLAAAIARSNRDDIAKPIVFIGETRRRLPTNLVTPLVSHFFFDLKVDSR